METEQYGLYPRGFTTNIDWKWPLVLANELVTLNYGKALREPDRTPGDIPVYGTNGQCGWHNTALVQGPGVVLGRKGQGPLGVEWCDTDFWVIDTAYFVTQKNIDLDLKYFYYLVKYIGLNHLKDGTSNPSLSRDTFGLQRLPLPSPQKQREIVKSVELLDRKIELDRQMNQTLESIAQALFKSWFVDFEPVKAKAQARAEGKSEAEVELAAIAALSGKSGVEVEQLPEERRSALAETAGLFSDALVESELGLIPKDWQPCEVKQIVNRLKSGKRYTKKTVLQEGRIPVFEQGSGVLMGFHNQPPDIDSSPERPRFIFGDHTCITHLSCEPFSISANVIPLESKELNSYWTFYAIKDLQEFQEYRRHWMELSIKNVIAPPSLLAEKFGEAVVDLYRAIDWNRQQLQTLAQLRDTLLPKLLSGELTLPAAQTQATEALD